MQKPVELMSNCYCNNCKKESIYCYTINGEQIDYKFLLDNYSSEEIKQKFDTKTLCIMKCMSCRTQYFIQWIDGLPRPLIEEDNLFLIKLNGGMLR